VRELIKDFPELQYNKHLPFRPVFDPLAPG